MGVEVAYNWVKPVLEGIKEFEGKMREKEIPKEEWGFYWLSYLQTFDVDKLYRERPQEAMMDRTAKLLLVLGDKVCIYDLESCKEWKNLSSITEITAALERIAKDKLKEADKNIGIHEAKLKFHQEEKKALEDVLAS